MVTPLFGQFQISQSNKVDDSFSYLVSQTTSLKCEEISFLPLSCPQLLMMKYFLSTVKITILKVLSFSKEW